MINSYTLENYKIDNQPIFAVYIYSELWHCVKIFKSVYAANTFIKSAKSELSEYGINLQYDCKLSTPYPVVIELITSNQFE